MKHRITTAALLLTLLAGSVGLSGCRKEVKVPATPQSGQQLVMPSLGNSPLGSSPLATPGTGVSPVNK